MANLLLDEVTGEKVSKTELKKRQKLREREAKKQEKEAAAPPKTQKKVSAEEDEANLTPNVSTQRHSRRLKGCMNARLTVVPPLAILRNPKQENQQTARDQEPGSLPTQVPGHYRPAPVSQGI